MHTFHFPQFDHTHTPSYLCFHQRLRRSFKIDGVYSSHSFPPCLWIMQWRQLMRHIWLSSWEAGIQLHKSAVAEDVWEACLWRGCPTTFTSCWDLSSSKRAWTHHSGSIWLWGGDTGVMKESRNWNIFLTLNYSWRFNIIKKVETKVSWNISLWKRFLSG